MGRAIKLEAHLTSAELLARYKATADAATACRWHLLWLISYGKTCTDAALLVGLSSHWASEIVHRYNATGAAGVADGRQTNPGAPPLLDAAAQQALAGALPRPPAEGGLWSGRKVAAWMAREAGKQTNPKRGIDVDPLWWTLDHWARAAQQEVSRCHGPNRPIPRSSKRKPYDWPRVVTNRSL